MKKSLLILGASGLTGSKAMQIGTRRFETFGTYNLRKVKDRDMIKLDVTDEDSLAKIISEIKPDFLLNATALHNVDYCESHPDESFKVNAHAVGTIAKICNKIGARMVHISTDYVFDGNKKQYYTEEDKPNPQSVYAKSKLKGESFARNANSYCVLRSSVIYGWTSSEAPDAISSSGKPMNFVLWALNKMSKNEKLTMVRDQLTTPTLADELASVAIRLCTVSKEMNGIFHVAGTSCVSRYDFALQIAKIMGHPRNLIRSIETKELVQVAKRPMQSCLSSDKVQEKLGIQLPDVQQSLFIMRSQMEVEAPSLLGTHLRL